jgi:hypothetical protein
MEVHHHEYDPQDEQEFITAYELRRTPVPPFVRVLNYEFNNSMWGGAAATAYT